MHSGGTLSDYGLLNKTSLNSMAPQAPEASPHPLGNPPELKTNGEGRLDEFTPVHMFDLHICRTPTSSSHDAVIPVVERNGIVTVKTLCLPPMKSMRGILKDS